MLACCGTVFRYHCELEHKLICGRSSFFDELLVGIPDRYKPTCRRSGDGNPSKFKISIYGTPVLSGCQPAIHVQVGSGVRDLERLSFVQVALFPIKTILLSH